MVVCFWKAILNLFGHLYSILLIMNFGLSGKCALITGGTHGIGLAIAQVLATEGCNIAICSRTTERLEFAQKLLSTFKIEILAIQANVLEDKDRKSVV